MNPFREKWVHYYVFVPNCPSFYSGMIVERFSDAGNTHVNRLQTILSQVKDNLAHQNAANEARINKSRTEMFLKLGDRGLINGAALHTDVKSRYKKITQPIYKTSLVDWLRS